MGLPFPLSGFVNGGTLSNGNRGVSVSHDTGVATYNASGDGLTLYSTAAAVLLEIQGSATKTIRVKHIFLWAQAGTKFFSELELGRATTVAGGSPVVATIGQYDTTDVVASAVVNSYAAASTSGTGFAAISARPIPVSPPAAGAVGPLMVGWDFGAIGKALVLRGTSQWLEVYNKITGLGTATFGFDIGWEEDNS